MKSLKKRIFVIAGMPRSGTTFFYYKLPEHPSIFVPFRKETNFFTTAFEQGRDWYLGLYGEMSPTQIGADISPSYFMDDVFIERAKAFNPEMKIILGVRTPSEFALSLYNQVRSISFDVPSFSEVLTGYNWKLGGKKIYFSMEGSRITEQIEKFRKAFGKNLLLFDFSLFQSDPLKILQAIESFLGLQTYFNEVNFENIVINAGKRKNIKVVTYILGRESIISALGRLFPRKFVVAMRKRFEEASKSKKNMVLLVHDPADMELAEKFFAGEDRVVKKIFSKSGIQLGTGEPFDRKKQTKKEESREPYG